MRDLIISTLDILSFVLVFILTVVGFLVGLGMGLAWAVGFAVISFIIGSFICGMWLVLSGCYKKLKHIEENTRD